MSARVDVAPWSTVVWCTTCPEFSESAEDPLDGHRKAARHERDQHPGLKNAQINLSKFLKKVVNLVA